MMRTVTLVGGPMGNEARWIDDKVDVLLLAQDYSNEKIEGIGEHLLNGKTCPILLPRLRYVRDGLYFFHFKGVE